jgi:phage tail sheath protein FI
VNPAAFAAGIIAQRENQVGVPYGPANVIAAGVVAVDDVITRPRHDELHQNAINVYMPERDGVRLTAGRTLSLDQTWRQLSVRRLVTMIRRALDQQMQWAVFEPNNQRLRFQISRALESFLRQLYRANAFVGATEDEAFFVKCDDRLNSREVEQAGQLLAQIGVAPAEPLEFIVLDLARDGDSFVIAEAD